LVLLAVMVAALCLALLVLLELLPGLLRHLELLVLRQCLVLHL
jgi:hypothetical protein